MNEYALDPGVEAHYAEGAERDRLLGGGAGRLEYLRTQELLARHMPPVPATVVDVGGGAGIYALPLAAKGYSVHLIDPVPLHVEQAVEGSSLQPEAPLASVEVGDARRLPREQANADAVLLLGPLYHLTGREDRVLALREARRVVRPGGTIVAAAVSRFASTMDGLASGFLADDEFEAIVERDVAEGQHRNPRRRPGWFTTAYFHLPQELREETAEAGLTPETLVAVEGPVWSLPDLGQQWLEDEARRRKLLDAIRRVEAEPSLLGASAHFLVVGRRPVGS
jgi:ubiquinone/menaquinone biosynthesis C-methylase UbiE